LTADPARRAQRALAAARAKHVAGAPDAALALLGTARAGPLDDLGRARADLLRAQIAYSQNRGSDAPPLLLRAARRLEPLDVDLARATYLDALSAAIFAGNLPGAAGVLEVARAALAAPPSSHRPRAADLLLEGVATQHAEGYAAGVPMLRRALRAFRSEDAPGEEVLHCSWLACGIAAALWDDGSWDALAARHVKLAREAGALTVLHLALTVRIVTNAFVGELAAASSLIEEMQAVSEAIGSHLPPYGPLAVAALRGREPEASRLIEATTKDVLVRGEALGLVAAQWASAVLHNGLGRYEDALAPAEQASRRPEALPLFGWSLVELIEAAARSGNVEHAARVLQRLSETTRASGSDWALGVEARSRALLSEGEVAERLYREAICRLGRTRFRLPLARAYLLYGEWLRRERRRLDARRQLRTAQQMLTTMGLKAFAERAARELLATGERARKRTVGTREELTAQEAQIAQLAREGLSNPAIGVRLFISPRTVEYHLHKVFTKLNINSRNQLPNSLAKRS
jgi:DNA-binding CsgD family transcriptional regulator